uniref:Reverse transcriptase domain-containing protein n=1 Tax=Tanacetum cinerariifolium TaxID=118510 RepID=A0A6L2LWS6_TANCI|nr:hypothetical protein [Tanacetum cinerariifolium]
MTRSSTKELFTPVKDPKQEFRSSRKHFNTLSLDESRSPDFDLFSDQEEYSEEEVAETMAETMKQYISKTRADYGSGIARPKIEDKDSFEFKGQFLKELRDNTFSGSDHEDANEHIEKVLRSWIYSTSLILLLTKQSMEDTMSKFMSKSAKRHEENSNLIKEIRALTDASIRNQGASIKTLEIQIRQMIKVLQERGFGSLPSSTKTNPRDYVNSISTIVEADSCLIRRMGSSQYDKRRDHMDRNFLEAYSYGASHNSVPRKEEDPRSFTLPCFINKVFINNVLADLGASDIKVPLILGRPFLSIAHAKIDVFKRKITLRVMEENIIFKSVKHARSLVKRVYMLSLRERMGLDLEARLMGETLVLNRSLDPFFEDY